MIGDLLNEVPPGKDRWLLSYVDLLTLLLAFFVVMYSVSVVNEQKLHEISASIGEALHKPEYSLEPVDPDLDVTRVDVSEALTEKNVEAILLGDIKVTLGSNDWVEFTLESEILFSTGNARIQNEASVALENMLEILAGTRGEIQVEGHTDNIPIVTEQFPSNWELSAARAASVVRFLESGGIVSTRLAALGLGETIPVEDNATEVGRARNRRVIFKVRKSGLDFDLLKGISDSAKASPAATEITPSPVEVPVQGSGATLNNLDDIDPVLLEQILRELENEG